MEHKITIITLWKNGLSQREIGKKLNISKTTAGKWIERYQKEGESIFYKNHILRESVATSYKEIIKNWLKDEPKLSAIRIWEKLRDEQNYQYGYDSVRRFLRSLVDNKEIHPVFEITEAGEEAQVDFGYVGLLFDPIEKKKRKAYVFCMRLIFSRYDYYEIVFDQKVKTFIKCHEHAFQYFSGVPKNVKVDNLKAAVLEANFYSPVYQKEYLNFSKHYGFAPIACRPYKPKDKAQVENGIKYVKGNFFAGRKFTDINNANNQLVKWMEEKSLRRHGTTRKRPKEVFLDIESHSLLNIPVEPYIIYEWSFHQLHPDCYIRVDKNCYSAPYAYVGEKLIVRSSSNIIEIYDKDFKLICGHTRAKGSGARVKNKSHFPEWVELISSGTYNYLIHKAEKYGEVVRKYCESIFQHHKVSGYGMVQGVFSLHKKYGEKKLIQAINRATYYNNFSYRCLKNILEKELIKDEHIGDVEDLNAKPTSQIYQVNLSSYDKFYH